MEVTYIHVTVTTFLLLLLEQFRRSSRSARMPQGCGKAPTSPRAWWDPLDISLLVTLLRAMYGGRLHESEREGLRLVSEKAGYPVRTYTFLRLGKSVICTCDAVNMHAILSSQFNDFVAGDREQFFAPVLGHHSVLTKDGDEWKASRASLRPALVHERASQLDAVASFTTKLIDDLKRSSTFKDNVVDVQALLRKHISDTSLAFLGLIDAKTDTNDEFGQGFTDAMTFAEGYLVKRILLGKLYWLADSVSFRQACKFLNDTIDKYSRPIWQDIHFSSSAATSAGDSGGKQSVLKDLAGISDSPEILISRFSTLVFAANGNIAALSTWLLYFLSTHPDSYSKLRTAVNDVYGHDTSSITLDSLKKCSYLLWVIQETLRLEPPATRGMKSAACDTTLPSGGGPDGSLPIFVPKGTEIIYDFRQMHRNSAYWGADADKWRPERWSRLTRPVGYYPFNYGPRSCIGQSMAHILTTYTFIRIAQIFERIEYCGDFHEEIKINAGLVGHKLGGVKVRFIPARGLP